MYLFLRRTYTVLLILSQSASGPEPAVFPLMFVVLMLQERLIYSHITLTADIDSLRLHPVR